MTNTATQKTNKLIILLTVIYMVSYITRINYGAVIAEMVRSENILKSAASLAVTGGFITYGFGQLISGFIGDRVQPRTLIFCGLLVTALMNILIPFCRDTYRMTAVWCVNGLAQAFMWPPIVKLMSKWFDDKTYTKACVSISWGSSFGTIFIYLAAPIFISVSGWRSLFFFSALCALVTAAVWMKKCTLIEMDRGLENESKKRTSKPRGHFLILLGILFAVVLQGSLRDGVTTWMPSYISETFSLSSSVSILSGVILPVFSIICFRATSWVYSNKLKNELVCSGAIFTLGFLSALLLYCFANKNVVLSVVLSALLTGCMHGVNFILVSIVPRRYIKYGSVSFISGLINSCTYVGAALSTYGIAIYSEKIGWTNTIALWVAIALVGAAICFVFSRKWHEFTE